MLEFQYKGSEIIKNDSNLNEIARHKKSPQSRLFVFLDLDIIPA
jgi:hypothetical protein